MPDFLCNSPYELPNYSWNNFINPLLLSFSIHLRYFILHSAHNTIHLILVLLCAIIIMHITHEKYMTDAS
jgi:hypothetical protein